MTSSDVKELRQLYTNPVYDRQTFEYRGYTFDGYESDDGTIPNGYTIRDPDTDEVVRVMDETWFRNMDFFDFTATVDRWIDEYEEERR